MGKAVIVTGPTGSGKTGLAIKLARKYGGEIVGADSMQIYRGLDVGTAKPDAAQLAAVPHHLIDICEPTERFSVAGWKQAAEEAIDGIISRGKLPIVCGGTPQYIFALLHNLRFSGGGADQRLRAELRLQAESEGGEALLEQLRLLDPKAAESLHANDTARIVRALELARTGMTKTRQNELSEQPARYELHTVCLNFRDRAKLYARIDSRVDEMLAGGMITEARALFALDAPTAAQAIGYKELKDYLDGREPLEAAAARIKQATRNYAKRQLTWYRKLPESCMIYADESADIAAEAEKRLGPG